MYIYLLLRCIHGVARLEEALLDYIRSGGRTGSAEMEILPFVASVKLRHLD
jgi:hypothetical protein